MRYLSLFSGIGGFELAIHSVYGDTAECVGFSEIDKFASSTYQEHFPHHRALGSVTEISTEVLESLMPVDLVVGGFPCQDLSAASRTPSGLDGNTSGPMFLELIRVLQVVRPTYFVVENVASMKIVCREFITATLCEKIDANTEVHRLDSQCFSAQRRNRLFWCNFPLNLPIPTPTDAPSIGEVLVPWAEAQELRKTERQMPYYMRPVPYKKGKPEARPRWHIYASRTSHAKSGPITANFYKGSVNLLLDERGGSEPLFRSFAPVEVERLQTFPENYTSNLSKTRRFKVVGNAVTVATVSHIMRCLQLVLTN